MNEENYNTLIDFLKHCDQYTVLHESSNENKNYEHYFIFITKKDITDSFIDSCLLSYQKKYPILDISDSSKKYMKYKKEGFYYIYVDTLNKKDVFFPEKEKVLKENTHNIISERILGKTVDFGTHLQVNAEKILKQAKHISISFSEIAKEEISKGLLNGVKSLKEKKPFFDKGVSSLKQKILKLKK